MKSLRVFLTVAIALPLFLASLALAESKDMENARFCMKIEEFKKAYTYLKAETYNNPDNYEGQLLLFEVALILEKGPEAIEAAKMAEKTYQRGKQRIAKICLKTAQKAKAENVSDLLMFAIMKDPGKKEEAKRLLDNLVDAAFAKNDLDAALALAQSRKSLGNEKNQEYADRFFEITQKDKTKERKWLFHARDFNRDKYNGKYTDCLIRLAKQEWSYKKAMNFVDEAVMYVPHCASKREAIKQNLLKKHTERGVVHGSNFKLREFQEEIFPHFRNQGQREKHHIMSSDGTRFTLAPYSVSPRFTTYAASEIVVKSQKPFYSWSKSNEYKAQFHKSGNFKSGKVYEGTFIINLNDEPIEIIVYEQGY
jgi:hypothetical protein